MSSAIEDVKEAVEKIARLQEKLFLKESPFHLQSCGGCGAPAFQQPCLICRYYPRGSDKGYWEPNVATIEDFRKNVEKSGPDGKDGTVATWYIRYLDSWDKRREPRREFVCAAAELDVPSIEDFWKVIAVEDNTISRDFDDDYTSHRGWSGFFELKGVTGGEYGERYADPKLYAVVKANIRKYADAVHDGDDEAMIEALNLGIEHSRIAISRGHMIGNLTSGITHMEKCIEMVEQRRQRPSM